MEQKQEEQNQMPTEEQPKLEENPGVDETAEQKEEDQEVQTNSVEEEEEPGFKIELACEVYASLPAVHQRRLLILCRDIFELGPSPDEFSKWKILQWTGNRWTPRIWTPKYTGKAMTISADGLSFEFIKQNNQGDSWGHVDAERINLGFDSHNYDYMVRAVHGVEFPTTTQLNGPQVCYFEVKHIQGPLVFGYMKGNQSYAFGIYQGVGVYRDTVGGKTHFIILPDAGIADNEIATVGCGLMKHLGKRKIFFTKNGQFIAKPIPLPDSQSQPQLFPFFYSRRAAKFEDSNFGLRPFQCKSADNEAKLLEEIRREELKLDQQPTGMMMMGQFKIFF